MKNKMWTFLMGLLCGMMLLSGGYAAASTVLTATPSTQMFYVDGLRVQFEAYELHGNNFVKLRDIGQAVDFAVDYDAATNSVHITGDRPYQQEVIQPAQTAPSPSSTSVTEESVQATLAELKTIYPDGVVYPTPYHSTSCGPYTKGIHCAGWAALCSDASFGNLPWRRVSRPTWDQIRPGDLVEYKNPDSYHVVVVVKKTDEYIGVTESGNHNKALWGGQYFKWWLEEQPQYVLYTRYPS